MVATVQNQILPYSRTDAFNFALGILEETERLGDSHHVPFVPALRPEKQDIVADRRGFQIPALSDPHYLRTGFHRIVNVLEDVRAVNKVEKFIRKREVLNVSRHQRFSVPADFAVAVLGVIKKPIDQVRCIGKRIAAAPDIKDAGPPAEYRT